MDSLNVNKSLDSFQQFEEKLTRAISVVKRTQAEKKALESELERLKAATKDCAREWDAKRRELVALRRERQEVRERIEKLLAQIDALTQADSAG
jgi:FtsZ-binding cell division protein ZapB